MHICIHHHSKQPLIVHYWTQVILQKVLAYFIPLSKPFEYGSFQVVRCQVIRRNHLDYETLRETGEMLAADIC